MTYWEMVLDDLQNNPFVSFFILFAFACGFFKGGLWK